MTDILVTGSNGQLGHCLKDVFSDSRYSVAFTTRESLDTGDYSEALETIATHKPSVVINASAYTAVDTAEDEKELAFRGNETAAENLAKACSEYDCLLIHISTDYVFDGSASTPYLETSPTNPQSVYGASKLAGEEKIQSIWQNHIIVRTAWVFSEHGNNFLKTMMRLAASRDCLSIVSDQIGCPTYAKDIAKLLETITEQYILGKDCPLGVFHYCGDTPVSWYEFASHIFESARKRGYIESSPELTPILSSEYPTAAKRPNYSVLNCSKAENTFGQAPSNWRAGINSSLHSLYDLE